MYVGMLWWWPQQSRRRLLSLWLDRQTGQCRRIETGNFTNVRTGVTAQSEGRTGSRQLENVRAGFSTQIYSISCFSVSTTTLQNFHAHHHHHLWTRGHGSVGTRVVLNVSPGRGPTSHEGFTRLRKMHNKARTILLENSAFQHTKRAAAVHNRYLDRSCLESATREHYGPVGYHIKPRRIRTWKSFKNIQWTRRAIESEFW